MPVLVAALGPRLLPAAGELADGAMMWMAPVRAIESHIAPKLHAAASGAGRPVPRIVAGLPVAVHDDEAQARATAMANASAMYAGMAIYERILEIGGAASPAEAAIVGSAISVRTQLQGLITPAQPTSGRRCSQSATTSAHPCCAPPIYYESCCPEQFPKEAHVVTASTITPTVGLEISGMTAAQLDTREAAEDARRELDQHGVVVYREVNISDEGLLAFSRRLGTPVVQRRPRHVGQHRDVAPRLAL